MSIFNRLKRAQVPIRSRDEAQDVLAPEAGYILEKREDSRSNRIQTPSSLLAGGSIALIALFCKWHATHRWPLQVLLRVPVEDADFAVGANEFFEFLTSLPRWW
jgi:hypothetical protein